MFGFFKKKKVLSFFDLFYKNNLLAVKNFVPIFLTKFQYNLYDKNYKFLTFLKFISLKNSNLLYLQYYDFSNYNKSYFLNLYISLKNRIYYNYCNVVKDFYLYWYAKNKFSIFKFINNTKFKYVKFGIHNYVKVKNSFNVKYIKILDKYLIKHKMFRSGKFFYNFLEYMKAFTYSVYKKNMLYGRLKYTKFDGDIRNINLTFCNVDKLKRLKGWFNIFNYIKKYSYLSYNANKNRVISHFIKKYHNFYYFIIRYFYKVIKNIKYKYIENFNFKKIIFIKILIFNIFYNKWFRFKKLRRLIKRKKLKRWKIRRLIRFRKLNYISFLLRIKSRRLNSNFLKRLKLISLIKKRKRLKFFKFKNNIRSVNWLLKFRRFKSIKNPFNKFRRNKNFKGRPFNKFINKNFKGRPFNKFKQLSNNNKKWQGTGPVFNYKNRNKVMMQANVKRV